MHYAMCVQIRTKSKGSASRRPAVKWDAVAESLRALLLKLLKEFAKKHPGELFSALFIDFPQQWARIRVHLTTPEALRRRAAEYMSINPELYARRSIESVMSDIRWEPGDFGYFEINATRAWTNTWTPIAEAIEKAAAKQSPEVYQTGQFIELEFLLLVTRTLIALDTDGSLAFLPKTRGFRVCCLRAEERADDAWKRMAMLRKAMLAANGENAARPSAASPSDARRKPPPSRRRASTRPAGRSR